MAPIGGGASRENEFKNVKELKDINKTSNEPVNVTTQVLQPGIARETQLQSHKLCDLDAAVYLPESVRNKDYQVYIEPLVTVEELTNFVLAVSPIPYASYLTYCHELIGALIRLGDSDYEVLGFGVFSGEVALPLHTVRAVSGETLKKAEA